MSHFYGTLSNQGKSLATKAGTKKSGIVCILASWDQALELQIWHNPDTKGDIFMLRKIPWKGKGQRKHIISGLLV